VGKTLNFKSDLSGVVGEILLTNTEAHLQVGEEKSVVEVDRYGEIHVLI